MGIFKKPHPVFTRAYRAHMKVWLQMYAIMLPLTFTFVCATGAVVNLYADDIRLPHVLAGIGVVMTEFFASEVIRIKWTRRISPRCPYCDAWLRYSEYGWRGNMEMSRGRCPDCGCDLPVE